MRGVMTWLAANAILFSTGVVILAEEKNPPVTHTNAKDGAVMIVIPDGEFQMGSSAEEIDDDFKIIGYPEDWKKHAQDELPRHRQKVKSFLIYRYEVTNAQYKTFCDETGHQPPEYWTDGRFPPGKGDHPVVQVSWHDAQAYCGWAGTRLPTEAEWEFAARGGAENDQPSRKYPWGDEWDFLRANSASYHAKKNINDAALWKDWYERDQSQYPLTTPVGHFEKSISPFGVHDMAGNAWEWCADAYAAYAETASQPDKAENDAEGADKAARVTKGGSWANVPFHLRSADRNSVAPETRNLYIGFRCAKDL